MESRGCPRRELRFLDRVGHTGEGRPHRLAHGAGERIPGDGHSATPLLGPADNDCRGRATETLGRNPAGCGHSQTRWPVCRQPVERVVGRAIGHRSEGAQRAHQPGSPGRPSARRASHPPIQFGQAAALSELALRSAGETAPPRARHCSTRLPEPVVCQ